MIISITGKIGSGKDTVAQIIQECTPYHNWEVKKWAGKLKVIAEMISGIPKEKFEDQDFKYTNLPECWDRQMQSGRYKTTQPMTVRDLLQLLGTEAMRNGLHENVWVNALISEYKFTHYAVGALDTELTDDMGMYPNWIITDTRFPNELEAARAKNGITIKVHRPGRKSDEKQAQHASETALDHVTDWDYVISNDGDLSDLRSKVYEILEAEKLLKFAGL
jgi:hypothetical protein